MQNIKIQKQPLNNQGLNSSVAKHFTYKTGDTVGIAQENTAPAFPFPRP